MHSLVLGIEVLTPGCPIESGMTEREQSAHVPSLVFLYRGSYISEFD